MKCHCSLSLNLGCCSLVVLSPARSLVPASTNTHTSTWQPAWASQFNWKPIQPSLVVVSALWITSVPNSMGQVLIPFNFHQLHAFRFQGYTFNLNLNHETVKSGLYHYVRNWTQCPCKQQRRGCSPETFQQDNSLLLCQCSCSQVQVGTPLRGLHVAFDHPKPLFILNISSCRVLLRKKTFPSLPPFRKLSCALVTAVG